MLIKNQFPAILKSRVGVTRNDANSNNNIFWPRVWEQCGGVLASADSFLHAADCGHAPALPHVHCQGGPGTLLSSLLLFGLCL